MAFETQKFEFDMRVDKIISDHLKVNHPFKVTIKVESSQKQNIKF